MRTDELKWLPNGSEFALEAGNPASSSSSKPKTYTSFSRSQDSLPEFANNPIGTTDSNTKDKDKIIIARLGPGQVSFLSVNPFVFPAFLLFIQFYHRVLFFVQTKCAR